MRVFCLYTFLDDGVRMEIVVLGPVRILLSNDHFLVLMNSLKE